ncbi:hypothetical protein TIFTF001_017621 [Ficus carica]|uniref:Uncharacterized protein n=1 Tax=Ficus carica TaxID=3494 RepID=A0AA88ACJ9_FICCA|nr:hypothetical protein TIFTF001_017621 [Ficus carica]
MTNKWRLASSHSSKRNPIFLTTGPTKNRPDGGPLTTELVQLIRHPTSVPLTMKLQPLFAGLPGGEQV